MDAASLSSAILAGSHGGIRVKQARLSDTLLGQPCNAFSSLATLPSNIQAVEAGLQFADGQLSHVAIFGPSGWGKSHLLEAIAATMQAVHPGVQTVSALHWLENRHRWDGAMPLLLDEVQAAVKKPRARHELKQNISQRVQLGRPTLLSFSAGINDRACRDLLANPRAWSIKEIGEPTVDEREQIVLRVAQSMKLRLHHSIALLIARHLHGNGRSIGGALNRLSLERDRWDRPEDLGPACGILMPYLLGADGWDIRDDVYEMLGEYLSGEGFDTTVLRQEIFCWLMLFVIGISETECAAFLGTTPTQIYLQGNGLRRMTPGSSTYALMHSAKAHVLQRLQER